MEPFSPGLSTLWPVSVRDEKILGAWTIPNISVHHNISLTWKILNNLVADWDRVAVEYQQKLDILSDEDAQIEGTLDLTHAIQPHFIQYLFSYIMFFFILEDGYKAIERDLNNLNRALGLHLNHGKTPQRTEYIQKLRVIRNFSTAHFAGTEKRDALDSVVGVMWEAWWPQKSPGVVDLGMMQFGVMGVSRHNPVTGEVEHSSNRQIGPIQEVHRQCTEHLAQCDLVCTDYLKAIKANLPMSVDSRTYSNPEEFKSGKPWVW